MNSPDDLLRRIRRLQDRAEIGELVGRYCLVMDDRDMTGMTELFTSDAVVRSSDGVMHASGCSPWWQCSAVDSPCWARAIISPMIGSCGSRKTIRMRRAESCSRMPR